MTEQSKANEDILCVRTCAHTWNIVFVFLTHIKDDYSKKKPKRGRCAGILEINENRESCGNMDCIWCNKMMDCSPLFSIVYWGLIL